MNNNIFAISWEQISKIGVHSDIIKETCIKKNEIYIVDLTASIKQIPHPDFQKLFLFYQEVASRGNRYVMFYDDKSKKDQEEYNKKQ